MPHSFARNALVLGLLAAIGPFAIDIYVPALPSMAEHLQTGTAAAQMTLMAFFLGFSVTQIIYGPVSDMVGRKLPLYFGLTVFTLASIGCASAPTIDWLIGLRFIQGVGAASVLIVMLFITFAFLGRVIPTSMVLSLEHRGPIAGMASALGGTLQMVTGAVMIVIASLFFNGTALPMVTIIALCAIAALILAEHTLAGTKIAAPAE